MSEFYGSESVEDAKQLQWQSYSSQWGAYPKHKGNKSKENILRDIISSLKIINRKFAGALPVEFYALRLTKNTNMLIEVETINQHTLENMRYGLNQQNIYSNLYHNGEATVNENCETCIKILLEAKNKHIPTIMIKYNKRKDKKRKMDDK